MRQTKSPLPVKVEPVKNAPQKTMDFFDAMKQLSDGKKIHKLEWENKNYYGFLNKGVVSLRKLDKKNYQWVISEGDLKGIDYIVL